MKKRIILTALLVIPMGIAIAQQVSLSESMYESNDQTQQGGVEGSGSGGQGTKNEDRYPGVKQDRNGKRYSGVKQGRVEGFGSGGQGPKSEGRYPSTN